MQTWIVEGTRVVSFEYALDLAQLIADARQKAVPINCQIGDEVEFIGECKPMSELLLMD